LKRAGGLRLSDSGFTKNISSSGVLFSAERELVVGGAIEFVITLIAEKTHPVTLKCVGKVVRRQRVNGTSDVAATVERYEFVRSGDEMDPLNDGSAD
jgi:hypothetical protein